MGTSELNKSVVRVAVLWMLLSLPLMRAFAQSGKPFLFQKPSLSATEIVFSFAGDLWIVPRAGGDARRLTSGVGVETDPKFSPDGKTVAFTGEYDGNVDVYTVPSSGGVPKRITYHPEADIVVGWSPDGKSILFRSTRSSPNNVEKLFTVSAEGGFPTELPLPYAFEGSYGPGAVRLAYVPTTQWQRAWKRYMGGQTRPIWLVNLEDLKVEKVPRKNSNDWNPMWVGNKVYFISDRSGPMTLFSYDTSSKQITQLIKNTGLDIKSACAGPGAIVYEQVGAIHMYDLASGKTSDVNIRMAGDLPEVRPHFVDVSRRIVSASISPNGARAVVEARGEILTIPAEKGDIRNITNTCGAMERSPVWSPDGKSIAYFSDESGEYVLHIRDQSGTGDVKKVSLGDHPTFYKSPVWSPDSKKISFADKHLTLWYVDVEKGSPPIKVDTTPYFSPMIAFDQVWSPDSKWIAYTKELKSHLAAVFVYSLDSAKSSQVTDGMSDARYPAFDRSGKYLFLTGSTDAALTPGWLNMTSMGHPVTRSIYLTVLRKDLPSPLAPESDEEKAKEPDKAAKPEDKDKDAVRIDLEKIGQRILALPIPARNYVGLATGKAGVLFIQEGPAVPLGFGGGARTLHRFDLTSRKTDRLTEGITGLAVSANGEKLLISQGPRLSIVSAAGPIAPGAGGLKTDGMQVYCDPKAEWKQMYNEAWRIERDFFYDANLHGLDLDAARARYAVYLDNLGSRGDLNYLFEEMLGELTCGHVFVGGGDLPDPNHVAGGLLGADYKIENGRYRFARVYDGENWNPNLKAPLTQPGVNVTAGEYLLAVNGRDVRPPAEVYSFFESTASKSVTIKVGPNPDGTGSRDVVVVPIANEQGLRNLAWVEDNRRKVDQLSNGRIAYVYLPDTAGGGYTFFNRYYFSQVGKEGCVLDERFNGGGLIADYVIDYSRRPLQGYFAARDGEDYVTPVGAIYGPKAMIINEYAGSGGDMMPWLFRDAKVGPLVGTRTWGGLVGMAGAAPLMDGGFTGAPQSGFWNPNGTWDVENHGVDPDIEVEMDPRTVRDGHDPQLEKAVAVVLDSLNKNPLPKHKKPAYPNYQKK